MYFIVIFNIFQYNFYYIKVLTFNTSYLRVKIINKKVNEKKFTKTTSKI